MQYRQVEPAVFIDRPNRFIAHCRMGGAQVTAHVKNTGRCRELLVPGCTVYLEKSENPARKTAYSLIAADRQGLLINLDSQAPNQVVAEAMAAGRLDRALGAPVTALRREVRYGSSRFDIAFACGERQGFVEVKGVTLEREGAALFPDAPTQRGEKHLMELCRAAGEGYLAAVCFLIQMKGPSVFCPNAATDPGFARALAEAAGCGVKLLAFDCAVTPFSLTLADPVPVRLEG